MPHKGGRIGGGRRIIGLLPESETAEAAREALARIDYRTRVISEPEDLPGLLRDEVPDLVLCDDRVADPIRTWETVERRASGADEPAPGFLAIISASSRSESELENAPALRHFLTRPFRAETLIALCGALIEQARDPAAGSDVAVTVRRPARFSARPLHAEAVAFARDAFEAARRGEEPDMHRGRVVAERLHTSLLQSNLLLNRALEPYRRFEIPVHCANVAIIAAKIALSLELSVERTLRVLQAGLVHDLGMARLPDGVLEKDGALTDEERELMQRHPLLGEEIAARLGAEFEWLRRAIRHEHERWDGSGYPDGVAEGAIDGNARILGVADVFEAFSHARSYRSPFTAFEALERVMALRGVSFEAEIVDALADEISVFPLDSYVKLSSGAIGRVVATNPENLMRPTVEVLWNASWTPVDPRIVSLDEAPEIVIERPLHESEVPIT